MLGVRATGDPFTPLLPSLAAAGEPRPVIPLFLLDGVVSRSVAALSRASDLRTCSDFARVTVWLELVRRLCVRNDGPEDGPAPGLYGVCADPSPLGVRSTPLVRCRELGPAEDGRIGVSSRLCEATDRGLLAVISGEPGGESLRFRLGVPTLETKGESSVSAGLAKRPLPYSRGLPCSLGTTGARSSNEGA